MFIHDTDRDPTTSQGPANNPSRLRSGYPDGVLALGVCGTESLERFACLVELVDLLDRYPERSASSSCASRCRYSGVGIAMTLWRPDPSPAAPSDEAPRPSSLRTPAWVSKPSGA